MKTFGFLSPLLVITSGTCRKIGFVSLTSFVCFSNTLAFSIPLIQRISLFTCKSRIFLSQVGNACSAGEVSASREGLWTLRLWEESRPHFDSSVRHECRICFAKNHLTCTEATAVQTALRKDALTFAEKSRLFSWSQTTGPLSKIQPLQQLCLCTKWLVIHWIV